jgi:hypothetical protein
MLRFNASGLDDKAYAVGEDQKRQRTTGEGSSIGKRNFSNSRK